MSDSNVPRSQNKRVEGFRTVFANMFGFQSSGTDAIVVFGIQMDPTNPESLMEEQVAVAMTPQGIKTLGSILTTFYQAIEKQSGTEIPTSDKTKEVIQMIEKSGLVQPPQKE